MTNTLMETIVLSAQVAISKTESGMNYVQVLPDNPRVGLVSPFCLHGRGQLLSNGTFDFINKPRVRRKPVLKLAHCSLSFGEDGYDRCIFTLPSAQRHEFADLLKQEVTEVWAVMKENRF